MINNKKIMGFMIVEVMIAIFIFSLGITGAISLIISGLKVNKLIEKRIVAINLAQEGLEIVRNMRDTNWMIYSENLRSCWNFWENNDDDLVFDGTEAKCQKNNNNQNDHPIGGGNEDEFIVDFDQSNFRWILIPEGNFASLNRSFDVFLQNGFYTHDQTGESTDFARKITIKYVDNNFNVNSFTGGTFPTNQSDKDNRILIISEVTFDHYGDEKTVSVATILTDYLNRKLWES